MNGTPIMIPIIQSLSQWMFRLPTIPRIHSWSQLRMVHTFPNYYTVTTVTINPHNGPWCLVGPKVFYVRQTQVITGPILGWLAAPRWPSLTGTTRSFVKKAIRGRKTMENDGKRMIVGHIWKTGFILEKTMDSIHYHHESCHYEINGIVGFGMILASIPIGHINTRARHWTWRRNSKSELISGEGNIFSFFDRPQRSKLFMLYVDLKITAQFSFGADGSFNVFWSDRCLAHECRNWSVNFTTWGRRLGANMA